jgi:outer membrane usher protein
MKFGLNINAKKYLHACLVLLYLESITVSAAQAESMSFTTEEFFMEVIVNQQPQGVVFILRRNDNIFLEAKELRSWRLRLRNITSLNHYGEEYYPLDALSGLTYTLNESTQTLKVEVPPNLYDATLLDGVSNDFNDIAPVSSGGFINYNVYSDYMQKQIVTSGLMELGGFGGWGAGQASFLAPQLNRQVSAIRMDSTLVRDQPTQMTSLRFGDVISGKTSWGNTVRLGGVQWATNFSNQPNFISTPLPMMSGEAVLPSTVDLYVDDEFRMRREVPSGPFSIQNLPVKIGQGTARMVVRDILGREKVITQPFFTNSSLLKPGLKEFSYELGFQRRNYGTDNNNYGYPLAVATHRWGITEQFTGEFHGKLLRNYQTLGLSGVMLSPIAGVLSGSLAMSHSEKGVGGLLRLGIQSHIGYLSFAANTQLTSQRFTKSWMFSEALAPRQMSKMFVNLGNANYGTFEVVYDYKTYRDRNVNKKLFARYNKKVGRLGNLSVSIDQELKMAFNLNFSMPLGNRNTVNLSSSAGPGREQVNLRLNSIKPKGSGVGYSLVSGVGESNHLEATVNMQNEVRNYTLAAVQSQDQLAFRGSASGGVAFLGGKTFFSRRINDSFAVVQVPGYTGVGIYSDNQLVGRTDVNGNLLVPNLRPYQKNSVRLEHADLPFDAQIDAVQLDVVPYFRSGLFVKFPVKSSRGALLSVVLENGDPLPAGAQVQIIEDNTLENELFTTGMRGEVYLTGLEAENRLRATWREQSCEFALPFPETTDPLPHLGTYICVGVEP